jgi:hypothetical protein
LSGSAAEMTVTLWAPIATAQTVVRNLLFTSLAFRKGIHPGFHTSSSECALWGQSPLKAHIIDQHA